MVWMTSNTSGSMRREIDICRERVWESLRECEGNIPQKRFKLKFFGLIDLSVGILNFSVYCVSLEAPNVETSSLPALNNL